MVNPEDTAGDRRGIEQASRLARKIPGSGMTESPITREAVNISRADPPRHAVKRRLVPGNWECDGCVLEDAEIICVAGILPEIISVDQYVFPDGLLKTGIVLIPYPG